MSKRNHTRRSDLLKFHRPKLRLDNAPIPALKPESKQCLHNLLQYVPSRDACTFRHSIPNKRRAAVLIALFVGRMGDLYVLLSRRASSMRTYAGDTSLPGGKWDPGDRSLEDTARREAFEEIGLPQDKKRVPLLCILEPYLAGGFLLVTPVVVLVLDNTIRPILNQAEVTLLFSHPFASFLSEEPLLPSTNPSTLQGNVTTSTAASSTPSSASAVTSRISGPDGPRDAVPEQYHTHLDIKDWAVPGAQVRMHRFLTGREAGGTKPIFGLTASILIHSATVGYGREPAFQVKAPDQINMRERIEYALEHAKPFVEAREAENAERRSKRQTKTKSRL